MNNKDIDKALRKLGATDAVQKDVQDPSARWVFQIGKFPVLIQTQESVNRMRIVAFIMPIDDARCPLPAARRSSR